MMNNKMILFGTAAFGLFLVLATTIGATAQNMTGNQSMSAGNMTYQTGNITGSNMTASNLTTASPVTGNMTAPS